MTDELYPIPQEVFQLQYQEWEKENDERLDRLIGAAWLEYHKACPKDIRMSAKQQLEACLNCPKIWKCSLGQKIIKQGGYSDLNIGQVIAEEAE